MLIARILPALRIATEAAQFDDGHGINYTKYMVSHGDPYNLVTEFDEDGGPTERGLEKARRFVRRAQAWTPIAWKIYGWVDRAKTFCLAFRCEAFGHDWVDDSYGGPDSGYMGCSCSRCGFSSGSYLY
jgi:hypothetical protein